MIPRMAADTSFAMTLKSVSDGNEESDSYSHTRTDWRAYRYIQCVVLFTDGQGVRRLRAHTTAISITTSLRGAYQGLSTGALVAFWAKKAAATALGNAEP